MDHHRPKGGVTENKDHPGYWWLAFNWRNFRFSCRHCNSKDTDPVTEKVGGKGNHFPLLAGEECRIKDECECQAYEDLMMEYPMLLDPTEPDDPQLLGFDINGKPGPTTENEQSDEYQRAEKSIEVYHLDNGIANRRRKEIYQEICKCVRLYRVSQTMLQADKRDRAARELVKKVTADLRKMTNVMAP